MPERTYRVGKARLAADDSVVNWIAGGAGPSQYGVREQVARNAMAEDDGGGTRHAA